MIAFQLDGTFITLSMSYQAPLANCINFPHTTQVLNQLHGCKSPLVNTSKYKKDDNLTGYMVVGRVLRVHLQVSYFSHSQIFQVSKTMVCCNCCRTCNACQEQVPDDNLAYMHIYDTSFIFMQKFLKTWQHTTGITNCILIHINSWQCKACPCQQVSCISDLLSGHIALKSNFTFKEN
jgi:hypothetical protein